MRAHLLGATAAGAAGAGLFHRQQRPQQHGWAGQGERWLLLLGHCCFARSALGKPPKLPLHGAAGCATPSPAAARRRLERLERQLQPMRLPPWLAAASLVSYCSAAARDGPPEATPPQQFSLMRMAGDGRCLFRALATGAHLLENAGELPAACRGRRRRFASLFSCGW